ncbi:hypothetical protein ROHU_030757 [Labeo rohita]|uniref:Uncharacterized protein n=1 Tax=Labeo rohita TaxID=84645 RepID=A0A498LPN8_LABRO|nr:hypothetical protein ROHU_030757 [Labeo rohita]
MDIELVSTRDSRPAPILKNKQAVSAIAAFSNVSHCSRFDPKVAVLSDLGTANTTCVFQTDLQDVLKRRAEDRSTRGTVSRCRQLVSDRCKSRRDAELETTNGTSEWRWLVSRCRTVPLSFPETLTCDVLLRCPRVGFSGAVRGTQSSAPIQEESEERTAREIVQAD